MARLVDERASQIVLGLDPDPNRLWPEATAAAGEGAPVERAARAVLAHCRLVLAATAGECVAVKPQVACFERLGAAGWATLDTVVREARGLGLLVLADGKRGDIDVSARAYGQAFFGATETPFGVIPGLGADALTASPLLGGDSLLPLIESARRVGAGIFALVRTSNPGAADLQDLPLQSGQPVHLQLAALVARLGADGVGARGLADVGAVVGATAPQHLAHLREAMPHTPLLLPGVGAQGGRVEELAPAFAPGPAGGLITSSRAIVNAYEKTGEDPASASRAEAARLRELAWTLSH